MEALCIAASILCIAASPRYLFSSCGNGIRATSKLPTHESNQNMAIREKIYRDFKGKITELENISLGSLSEFDF